MDGTWHATRNVWCGDNEIKEYQTDGRPVAVTAPRGTWVRMRGTDRAGSVVTFRRSGDAWVKEN